jgi:hypothetical protein
MSRSPKFGCICANSNYLACISALLDGTRAHVLGYWVYRVGQNWLAVDTTSDNPDTTNTSYCARKLTNTFKSIELIIALGEGAGAPSDTCDVRLGDVVIGSTVIPLNFDFEFPRQSDIQPVTLLRSSTTVNEISSLLQSMALTYPRMKDVYSFPGFQHDHLIREGAEVERTVRQHPEHPVVHFGSIAYARACKVGAKQRDKLGRELDVICFGTQAIQSVNTSWLLIQGISNYADHVNGKGWARYASATPAAYVVHLLRGLADEWQDSLRSILRERFGVVGDATSAPRGPLPVRCRAPQSASETISEYFVFVPTPDVSESDFHELILGSEEQLSTQDDELVLVMRTK